MAYYWGYTPDSGNGYFTDRYFEAAGRHDVRLFGIDFSYRLAIVALLRAQGIISRGTVNCQGIVDGDRTGNERSIEVLPRTRSRLSDGDA